MIVGVVKWTNGVMRVENKNFAEWCAETKTEEELSKTKQEKMAKAVRELAAQLRRRARCLT